MKKLQSITLAVAAIVGSICVQAEGVLGMEPQPNIFHYNYVELTYIAIDDFGLGDDPLDDADLDGFRFKASYDIDPNLSLIGSFSLADDSKVDLTTYSFGAAYHQKLPKTELTETDFIVHAEIERIEAEIDTGSGERKENDTGLLAGATARIRVVEPFEIFCDLSFRTAGDNDVLATVGGRYYLTPKLLGVAGLEISETDTVSLGLRYNY